MGNICKECFLLSVVVTIAARLIKGIYKIVFYTTINHSCNLFLHEGAYCKWGNRSMRSHNFLLEIDVIHKQELRICSEHALHLYFTIRSANRTGSGQVEPASTKGKTELFPLVGEGSVERAATLYDHVKGGVGGGVGAGPEGELRVDAVPWEGYVVIQLKSAPIRELKFRAVYTRVRVSGVGVIHRGPRRNNIVRNIKPRVLERIGIDSHS